MSEPGTTILGAELETSLQENPLGELVGDGKKYKSIDDLAKAYKNADQFIETLKREKQELESKYSTLSTQSKTVEEILAALQTDEPTIRPQEPTAPTPVIPTPVVAPEIKPEDIRRALDTMKKQEEIKENQQKAWEGLAKLFGTEDAAKEVIKGIIQADPLKQNVINELGSLDPEGLVIYMSRFKKQDETFSPDNNSRVPFPSENATQLTWKKAEEIRKGNKKMYDSAAFQAMLEKAAATNPAFWQGTQRNK